MLHPPGSSYRLAQEQLADDQTLGRERRTDESIRGFLRRRFAEGAWRLPLMLFLASFVIFSLFAWSRIKGPSPDPHFAYLANTYNSMIAAKLGGEESAAAGRRAGKLPFELDREPPHRNDWASWWEIETRDGEKFRGVWLDKGNQGRFKTLDGRVVSLKRADLNPRERKRHYFMSFPPGPSFLMMPMAAVWGYQINDVLFTIFFAALNVMLTYLLLRRLSVGGRSGRGLDENLWLTLLFGFGTAHLWCSVMGQVWFTALIVGISFTLLYIHCAIDARHPFWAGVCMAMAFSTRTPLLFTSIFFFAFIFFPGGKWRRDEWGDALKKLALFCAPCLVFGLTLIWMNYVRFESLSEFGHRYLAAGGLERIKQYGLFNYHFLSKNLTAAFTLLPRLQAEAPYIVVSKHGMSLLVTTPALIYLFWPKARESTRDKFWFRLLWAAVAVTALPGFFYQNTGYAQFGFRFSLDYTPYLILLLAVGRQPLTRLFKALVLVGVVVNAFGAVIFNRFDEFFTESFFP